MPCAKLRQQHWMAVDNVDIDAFDPFIDRGAERAPQVLGSAPIQASDDDVCLAVLGAVVIPHCFTPFQIH